jgi:hypothetical protein
VNVDGNYNVNGYAGGGIPLFSKLINLNPSVNFSSFENSGFINFQKNKTLQNSMGAGLDIDIDADTISFQLGASFNYNTTESTLNNSSNKPYSSQKYTAELSVKLPYKFSVETNAEYNINSQRTPGYNINYVLWNASINKMFLKNENLIISVVGTDLLNQNISTDRTTQDNVITDTKTNVISRYFLLKAVFKFNSTKTKDNDDWGM